MILLTIYQGFPQEYFLCFPYINLCKHMSPGAWSILATGPSFQKLRCLLDLCNVSNIQDFRQDVFMLPLQAYVKHVTPRAGLF